MPSPITDYGSVTGAYPIDIDGDRHTDLAILRVGGDVILHGLGDCLFAPPDLTLGLRQDNAWTVGFSATWEGDAALPTLAFGDYLVPGANPDGTTTCADSRLVRPAPDGTTYDPAIPLRPGMCALSMLFSDWDRSGRRDLRVSNDRHYDADAEEQLWRIAPGEPPKLYTRADGWARLSLFGMGIASQDVTGDGYPEVYLTSQGDNKLQTLADGRDSAGVRGHRVAPRRDRPPAVRRRRHQAVDGLDPGVRRRQQRPPAPISTSRRATSRARRSTR